MTGSGSSLIGYFLSKNTFIDLKTEKGLNEIEKHLKNIENENKENDDLNSTMDFLTNNFSSLRLGRRFKI